MASVSDFRIAAALQPKPADYGYDLDAALNAVVGLRATVPSEAFTADILGTERGGNGVISQITTWVEANYSTVTVNGQTLYDLTKPKS